VTRQEAARPTQKPKVTFSEQNLEFPPSAETDSVTTGATDSRQFSADQNFTKKFQDFLIANSNGQTEDGKGDASKRPKPAKSCENRDPKLGNKAGQLPPKNKAVKDFVPYQSVPAKTIHSQIRASVRENAYVRPVLNSKTITFPSASFVPSSGPQSSAPRRDRPELKNDDASHSTLNETFDVDDDDDVVRGDVNENVAKGCDVEETNGASRFLLKSSRSRRDDVEEIEVTDESKNYVDLN